MLSGITKWGIFSDKSGYFYYAIHTEIARRNHVPQSAVQSVFQFIHFGLPAKLPETICIDEFKGNSGVWSPKSHRWYRNKYHCSISDGDSHSVIESWIRSLASI